VIRMLSGTVARTAPAGRRHVSGNRNCATSNPDEGQPAIYADDDLHAVGVKAESPEGLAAVP
jgi:hypothetical protein